MLVGIEVGSPLLNNRRFLSHAEVVGYRLEHRCRIRGVRAWLVRCSTQGVNCEVLQPVGLLSVAGKMGEMLLKCASSARLRPDRFAGRAGCRRLGCMSQGRQQGRLAGELQTFGIQGGVGTIEDQIARIVKSDRAGGVGREATIRPCGAPHEAPDLPGELECHARGVRIGRLLQRGRRIHHILRGSLPRSSACHASMRGFLGVKVRSYRASTVRRTGFVRNFRLFEAIGALPDRDLSPLGVGRGGRQRSGFRRTRGQGGGHRTRDSIRIFSPGNVR